jgi:8-oxo-dGTP pyrophosphatase MutT (NUDIX family)
MTERHPTIRPKDAAALILLREGRHGTEALMGRRHARHVFMPEVYVFPGGRVDPGDARVPVASPLCADVEERLTRACTPARARALGVAAIRETFEETGFILAQPVAPARRVVKPEWQSFHDAGLAPALDLLEFVCRATTPPGLPRRFNARFFLADATHLRGEQADSLELEDLQWITLEPPTDLPIANITRCVLSEVRRLLATPPVAGPHREVPTYRYVDETERRFTE